MSLRRQLARAIALFRGRQLDRELDEEIAAHLELAEHEARARGLDPVAARQQALRAFGGVDQMKEQHRDVRSVRWAENIARDVRYGIAGLRRDPLFAVVAIGVLALGIGANVAVFSLVDAVLFRPLPFPQPDRLVRWWEAPTPTSTNSTTVLNFTSIAGLSQSFDALSAEARTSATAVIEGEPVRLQGRLVSADHFRVFGVVPVLGRGFIAEEDRAGGPAVVVISHAAWQTRFGGDPAILARTLLLDNVPHQIVGVLPAGAFDRDKARPQDDAASFWKPQAFTEAQLAAGSHWLNPVGRLKPGISIEAARADLLAARQRIDDIIPAWKRSWSVVLEPYDEQLVESRFRQALYVALAGVVVVLAIACANLTNLLLARGVAREKELAVRAALGAGRHRMVAQLLTEASLLGILGAVAGTVLAEVLIRVAVPLLPAAMPYTAELRIDARALGWAAALGVFVSTAVGILPALRLSRGSLATSLNQASRGSSSSNDRIRRVIVGATVAASLVLVCTSFLLFKSLVRLQQVDIGVRAPRVLAASVDISREAYPTAEAASAFYRRFVERVRAMPGVESASLSADLPLEGTGGEYLRVPGNAADRLTVRFKRAGDAYFETLGIPVIAGRTFTEADRADGELVAIVNEALAADLRRIFGVNDPVGQVVDLPVIGYSTPTVRRPMRIVGIVANERVSPDLRAEADSIAYVPLLQAPITWLKLAARVAGEPLAVAPAVRQVLREIDSHVALADVQTIDDIKSRSLSGLREPAWLIGMFAALATALAALGLYGVVAHAVSARRREIGVRMALGADGGDVIRLVLHNVAITVAVGTLAGLAGSVAATRITQSLLFEVSSVDPAAFAVAAIGLLTVGLIAAAVPARRAVRVDPTIALRSDG
ncbi:MAG TPA: ABC transporter permease [Vicinamibacterales bacterium]|nr:ABC transporter permease [Vicinamibacterales bacterium]